MLSRIPLTRSVFVVLVYTLFAVIVVTGAPGCAGQRARNVPETAPGANGDAPEVVNSGPTTQEAMIALYLGAQTEELARIDGAVTKRQDTNLRVTWNCSDLFDFDSAMLKPESRGLIEEMADVYKKYPDTDIVISGYTNSEGPEEYSQKLSERRAVSIRGSLIEMGVAPSRLEVHGYGVLRPDTADEVRHQHDHIEIEIRVNEAFKARADAAGNHH